jgi:hypothetical protein
MIHEHRWDPESGDCESALQIGGRVVACHARKCAAPDCTTKREPPGDFCIAHLYLGRRLRLPARGSRSNA